MRSSSARATGLSIMSTSLATFSGSPASPLRAGDELIGLVDLRVGLAQHQLARHHLANGLVLLLVERDDAGLALVAVETALGFLRSSCCETIAALLEEAGDVGRLVDARVILEVGVDQGVDDRGRLVLVGVLERDLDHRRLREGRDCAGRRAWRARWSAGLR